MMKTEFKLAMLVAAVTTFGVSVVAYGHGDDTMNMTMGPMNMNGTVNMNGKQYDMTCSMKPIGKPKSMSMHMSAPMNMSGTMTMMGQKYNCTMKLNPKE